MLFNSLKFLIFFPLVTFFYFFLPHRYRWFFLLMASAIFYAAFVPSYLLILFFLIVVDYFVGIKLENARGGRKFLLLFSIISNLGMLFIFKYFNFFSDNFTSLFGLLGWNYSVSRLSIILPIGLSFHTFQSLSYIIEVYRGRQSAEHHLGIYALYVMFYPQLVAGPIERPQNLLHQFREEHIFNYRCAVEGLQLILWGLFKKMVIADRLAFVVDRVFNNPVDNIGPSFWVATFFFAFQIYCDFSGYSDIAIGAAKVMGFKLMNNFERPYFAQTISQFWQRWHISLSSWFRDYLYIPLGGNRVGHFRWCRNILITFIVSGFWHGANWTYIIWGGLHGFYYLFGAWTNNLRGRIVEFIRLNRLPSLHKAIKVSVVFFLSSFAWIFFRANNIGDAFYIITHSLVGWDKLLDLSFLRYHYLVESSIGLTKIELVIAVLSIVLLQHVYYIQEFCGSLKRIFYSYSVVFRRIIYYCLILGIIFFGIFGKRDFIYFQF